MDAEDSKTLRSLILIIKEIKKDVNELKKYKEVIELISEDKRRKIELRRKILAFVKSLLIILATAFATNFANDMYSNFFPSGQQTTYKREDKA